MSDGQHIPELVHLGSDPSLLVAAQHIAAKRLLDYDGEVYPRDGCAITLSVLLQEAGINLKDTYQAIALGNLLQNDRKWKVIALEDQQTGDVGSTCGPVARHGYDHIKPRAERAQSRRDGDSRQPADEASLQMDDWERR